MRAACTWCILMAACGDPCRERASGRVCGPDQVALAYRDGGPLPVVRGRLADLEGWFLLDTGAAATVISSSALGVDDDSVQRLAELCLGELCFERPLVRAWDTPFSNTQADETLGFVGVDLLRDLRLELGNGARAVLGADRCAGERVAVQLGEHGRPFVSIAVEDHEPMTALLDTGALFTLLSRETAETLGAELERKAVTTPGCDVHGCAGAFKRSTVGSYCLAGACSSDLAVKYPVWDAVGANFLAAWRWQWLAQELVLCSD